MDASGIDRTDGHLEHEPRFVLLPGRPAASGGPHPGRALTRREWKVVGHLPDVGALPVATWRTPLADLAPIRRLPRRSGRLGLRRRIWFGLAALCLFTLGTMP